MINAKKINKIFSLDDGKKIVALQDVSFAARDHEFVVLLGPSGCGKSTLLRMIAGLSEPSHGALSVKAKRLAMVFQNFALFPWLTVYENIALAYDSSGQQLEDREMKIVEVLERVGMRGFENRKPVDLSGGQKQRIGIARALVVNPDLLLLDEPFSALDSFTARALRKDLLEIWKKDAMTCIMVTHLIEEAVQMADTIVVLSNSPGRVVDIIEVRLPRPRNLRSAQAFHLIDKIAGLIKA